MLKEAQDNLHKASYRMKKYVVNGANLQKSMLVTK